MVRFYSTDNKNINRYCINFCVNVKQNPVVIFSITIR